MPWLSIFYMFIPCWDSVSNHNRQIVASSASVHTHSPFGLAGDYAPTPMNAEFILRLCVLQTFLKGTPKRRLLCRDVTNRYILIIFKGYREIA